MIIGTSANISGAKIPVEEDELPRLFLNSLDLILLGGIASDTASTVVDLTTDKPVLVREGTFGEKIGGLLEESV